MQARIICATLCLFLALSLSSRVFLPLGSSGDGSTARKGKRGPTPRGQTEFALRMLSELTEREGSTNVFLSPFSLSLALGMALSGTTPGSRTEGELVELMGFGSRSEALEELGGLLASVPNSDDLQLTVANALFTPKGAPSLKEGYVADMRAKWGAEGDDSGLTAQRVNKWVNAATSGMIPSIVTDADIGPSTLALLLNAVYFKGEWVTHFDPEATRKADFTTETGATTQYDAMSRQMHVGLYPRDSEGEDGSDPTEGMRAIAMPYQFKEERNRYQMLILLPPRGQTLNSFCRGLTASELERVDKELAKNGAKVFVKVPKMDIKYDYQPGIHTLFKEMGYDAPFSPSTEWDEMTQGSTSISAIKQKAVLEFDETGTKAAAATAVMLSRSLFMGPSFEANRPFAMVLYDRKMKLPLFVGAIHDPSRG